MGKDDVSSPVIATIDKVVGEMVGQGAEAEERRVAHFREKNVKPLIINSGNWQVIEAISGQPDDENWGGTVVEIYVDPNVSFGGKRVGGLRVRESSKTAQPTQSVTATPGTDQAMLAAYNQWKAMHTGESADIIRAGFKAAFAAYFPPGTDRLKVTQGQWIRFAKDGFKPVTDPFAGEGDSSGVPEADLPF